MFLSFKELSDVVFGPSLSLWFMDAASLTNISAPTATSDVPRARHLRSNTLLLLVLITNIHIAQWPRYRARFDTCSTHRCRQSLSLHLLHSRRVQTPFDLECPQVERATHAHDLSKPISHSIEPAASLTRTQFHVSGLKILGPAQMRVIELCLDQPCLTLLYLGRRLRSGVLRRTHTAVGNEVALYAAATESAACLGELRSCRQGVTEAHGIMPSYSDAGPSSEVRLPFPAAVSARPLASRSMTAASRTRSVQDTPRGNHEIISHVLATSEARVRSMPPRQVDWLIVDRVWTYFEALQMGAGVSRSPTHDSRG